MTDTNTTPTNPLSEAEMSLITRLANFIVASSDLHAKFPVLEAEVEHLRREITAERTVSSDYANQLIVVGKERDDARAERDSAVNAGLRAESDYRDAEARAMRFEREGNETLAKLEVARRERDEAQFRNLELSEEVERLKGKLARFRSVLIDEVDEMPRTAPVPETKPEEPQGYVPFTETTPASEPAPVAGSDGPSVSASDPAPAPVVRVYEGEVSYMDFWNTPGREPRWDNVRSAWYYVKPDTSVAA